MFPDMKTYFRSITSTFLSAAVLVSIAGCGDDGVSSDQQAELVYVGLDESIVADAPVSRCPNEWGCN